MKLKKKVIEETQYVLKFNEDEAQALHALIGHTSAGSLIAGDFAYNLYLVLDDYLKNLAPKYKATGNLTLEVRS